MKHDLILKNGNIVTMDNKLDRCGWVTIKDGKISVRGNGEPYDLESDNEVLTQIR